MYMVCPLPTAVWGRGATSGHSLVVLEKGVKISNITGCAHAVILWPYSTSISFVGNDYFCDTGYNSTTYPRRILYTNNPLWDSKGCGSNSTCCQFNNPPWFCKTLSQSTTDDLEVRICNGGNGVDIYTYSDNGDLCNSKNKNRTG